jgi:hypothetical protein
MEVKKYYCDHKDCKKERVGKVQAFSHDQMDASGNGREYWHGEADLCIEHLLDYTEALIETLEKGINTKPLSLMKILGIKYEIR